MPILGKLWEGNATRVKGVRDLARFLFLRRRKHRKIYHRRTKTGRLIARDTSKTKCPVKALQRIFGWAESRDVSVADHRAVPSQPPASPAAAGWPLRESGCGIASAGGAGCGLATVVETCRCPDRPRKSSSAWENTPRQLPAHWPGRAAEPAFRDWELDSAASASPPKQGREPESAAANIGSCYCRSERIGSFPAPGAYGEFWPIGDG